MPANTSLDLVSLDFDAIKSSLISFFKSQDIFKDYDFAGSDLNVLVELLALNTQRHAFFTNMGFAEAFLDSAQLRTSVLSRAKELNYTPRSARSPKANITVTFQATGTSQPYVIQKGQSFSAQIKNQNYIFSIPETLVVASANTTFSFTTDIYEGTYFKDSYIFDSNAIKRFKINNANVDTDSISVNVFEDNATIGDIYQKTTSLLGLTATSKVFFLQTNAADGNYEILFGDGNTGYQPKNGALIVIDYRITKGKDGNGSSIFSINFDPTMPTATASELTSNITIATNTPAIGGDSIEDIEETRFLAPRWFQTQERAVIPSDFEVLMKTQFPEINAVNSYGGETLTPPQFGKVVVAIDIANVSGLPQSKIDQYNAFLKPRMMLTEFPIFVSPQYTYIDVNTIVRYNINVTTETDSRIKTLVSSTITDFNNTSLNKFNITFRMSKFAETIDNADPSIVSNVTNCRIYKKINPQLNSAVSIVIDYAMQLKDDLPDTATTHAASTEKCLSSTTFLFKGELCTLEDDGNGTIRIVKPAGQNLTAVQSVGTINYATGLVQLNDFSIDQYDGDSLKVFVLPKDPDITVSKNTILRIEPSNVAITIQQVRE